MRSSDIVIVIIIIGASLCEGPHNGYCKVCMALYICISSCVCVVICYTHDIEIAQIDNYILLVVVNTILLVVV